MREQCGSHNETERSSKHNLCEFEGLKLSQFVQRPAALLADSGIILQATPAKLRSSQNKKRPPLTMEPSIDDPLAAVKNIMCRPNLSVNSLKQSTHSGSACRFITHPKGPVFACIAAAQGSFFVTPAQAGVQRKDLDSRLRGNDKPCKVYLASNESEKLDGALA